MPSLVSVAKQVGDYNRDGTPSSETTVLVSPAYNAGRPFTITFVRSGGFSWPEPSPYPYLIVRDFFSEKILAQMSWANGGILGRALVVGDVVHLIATQDYEGTLGPARLVHSVLNTDWTVAAGAVFATGPSGSLFGAGGVTQRDGKIEVNYGNTWGTGFYIYSDATFSTLVQNVPTGLPVDNMHMTQNPQWYAPHGCYYALALDGVVSAGTTYWVSGFYRVSPNRTTWTKSPVTFLDPRDMGLMEGINNSDVTWTEYNGEVIGVYLSGDQSTWSGIRKFRYPKPLENFYREFFPA